MIIYMAHHYREPSGQGGLRTWHQVNELSRYNTVNVVVPGIDTLSGQRHSSLSGGQLWSTQRSNDNLLVYHVNSVRNVRHKKWRRVAYYLSFSLLQFLCALRIGRPQLILTTSMPLSSLCLAFVLSRIRRVPLTIDVRDLPTDLAIEIGYFRDSFLSRVMQKTEAFVYQRTEIIITVSEGMRKLLLKKGVTADQIHVVPIGYDELPSSLLVAPEQLSVSTELTDKFVVLYTGTMGHVVDIETILETARLTREDRSIIYLLVGDGQRLDEYKERASTDGSNCIFTGRVEKHSIPAYCALSDVCLYPLVDGQVIASLMGNKIFDYMGAGRATIYSGPQGDVADLIIRAKAGITLEPGDAAGIARAIQCLKATPGDGKSMGTQGESYVCQHLTAQHAASKLAALVRNAIDKG